MSIVVSPEKAADAGVDVLLGLCQVVNELFDSEAASRLVGMDASNLNQWWEVGVDTQVRESLRVAALPVHASTLAEYAWGGRFYSSELDLDATIIEALVVLPLLQDGDGELVDAHSNGVVPIEARDILRNTLNAALGRRSLDGSMHGAITIPMLAALAGVSEKTVRMAANPKNPDALRTTKIGNSTFVEPEDALEWLRRRSGFQETIYNAQRNSTPTIKDPESLAIGLKMLLARRAMTVFDAARTLKWNSEKTGALEQLEQSRLSSPRIALTPEDLLAFARLMELDDPLEFAKQAYKAMVAAFADAMISVLEEANR